MNEVLQEMISEESEDDGAGESHEEMIYRRKYQMLLERCEVLQQDNERLVHRIQQVYKYTRQVRKERKYLMDRLDKYGDNWRQGITQYLYEDNAQHLKSTNRLKQISSNSDKRSKKPSNSSSKKSLKEKTDDVPPRKHSKESGGKTGSKNFPGYNFM